jgi:hypothetical protein
MQINFMELKMLLADMKQENNSIWRKKGDRHLEKSHFPFLSLIVDFIIKQRKHL